MKKILAILCVCVLCLATTSTVFAAENKYSLPTEGVVVMQNQEDRAITPNSDFSRNPLVPGESPTTGMPWSDSLYQPMIVQISNPSATVTFNDEKHTFGGLGPRAPWGGQYADIVFEGILYRTGETRVSFLVSDAFEEGQPLSMGPVRSARIGHVLLQQEWDAGLVFGGGPRKEGNDITQLLTDSGARDAGLVFNVVDTNDWKEFSSRTKGVRAPDNLDANVVGLRGTIPATTVAVPRPFLFSDLSPYVDGYEFAYNIGMDWGHERYVSHFYYDEMENIYLRYSGTAPYMSFVSAQDREEENQEQLSFSNVIIQRVHYDYVNNNKLMPDMKSIGQGNADIFIGGRYIPGYWVRKTVDDPTVFFDDKGNELVLTRGKTFIGHLPPESLLTYSN